MLVPASSTPISTSSTPASTETADGSVASAAPIKRTPRGALIGGVVGGVSGLIVLVLACIIWTRMCRRTHVGSKGSEWSQNPRFEEMYSSMQATADFDAVKPSQPEGKFSLGGHVTSQFRYRNPDIFPETPGWNDTTTRPPSPPTMTIHNEKTPVNWADRSKPRSFLTAYGTGSSQDSEYSPTLTRSRSGAEGSVSLSAFDFAGPLVPDDAQTMLSFPRSVATNGFTTLHESSPNVSRAPTRERKKDLSH